MKYVKSMTAVALAITLAMTSGCQNMNKQNMGTMIGTGTGALVGSFFGEGRGKLAAILAGGLIGGFAGNLYGKSLDEEDKADLDAATQKALENAKAGSTTNWKSAHSGATAQITVGKAYNKTENVTVKRLATIEPATNMSVINKPYITVMKSSNVRAAPRVNGAKVASLKAGVEFNAIGQTGDWILVGRKGVQVGYIQKDLVMPADEYAALPTPPQKAEKNVAATTAKRAQVPAKDANPFALAKLDELDTKIDEGDAKSNAEKVVETPAVSTRICREMKADVTAADGKKESATTTSCKPAFGSWAANS
ncbi:hypothetical protein C6383_05060 [Pseudomonas syringae pv. actinidiae]|uniref:SH3 domain-containing protein n=1 Tax=Pseudomonas syringae TaxID=317 RepID=UPI000BB56364|nr:SH3 domain-containing protein [Pseudomonas syringae]PBK49584.1 hypothetical protein BUE61_22590 [Pseudomonas syringae pv. actinidiae]PBK54244.1 hypothetical protein BUE60_10395 [Pseudomonas syringae pv. actinidiae]RJX63852.1 hypothetical protein C6383_05060 [Pseudomonas syringae pv. actinidiae]